MEKSIKPFGNKSYRFYTYHILACCVLHNVCLQNKDELQLQDEVIVINAEERREEGIENINYDRTIAEAKRNNICANLNIRNV